MTKTFTCYTELFRRFWRQKRTKAKELQGREPIKAICWFGCPGGAAKKTENFVGDARRLDRQVY
jgi:hypothetical protein